MVTLAFQRTRIAPRIHTPPGWLSWAENRPRERHPLMKQLHTADQYFLLSWLLLVSSLRTIGSYRSALSSWHPYLYTETKVLIALLAIVDLCAGRIDSMSGIEAAGFVLAAFPLAISALEHYRATAETLGVFWKIRREYKTWTRSLNICQLAFEQNLEQFLLPLIADEDELQRLISGPGSPEWQNPELEMRLRQRLPKSYYLYL